MVKCEKPISLKVNDRVRTVWQPWLAITRERCHLHFNLEGGTLDDHVTLTFSAALGTALRIKGDLGVGTPRRVLDLGCSVGFNTLALARIFPDSEIYGVEPDLEAVKVAKTMAEENDINNVQIQCGFAETLPYREGYFDLIVCNTVIEHVRSVESTISEMARVLTPGGFIHLEAPNYNWPYEPHVNVWGFPRMGKRFLKFLGGIQNKSSIMGYVDHLQFVHPKLLEHLFFANGLDWHNRVSDKIKSVINGNGNVKKYLKLAFLLKILCCFGNGRYVSFFVLKLAVYPSMLYTIKKK